MSIQAWEVPADQRPPWTIKDYPAGWYEMICDSWKDYKDLVDWLDRMITGEFDIHQARPFQPWPRVYYVGLSAERDLWSFKLTWVNTDDSPADNMSDK